MCHQHSLSKWKKGKVCRKCGAYIVRKGKPRKYARIHY